VALSSEISRRRSHCSGRYQLTPMINVLLSRCCLMVCHIFPSCRLLSILHTSQRHLVGYDANDLVAFQLPLSLCLAMIPRLAVSQVSLFPRMWLNCAGGREGRLGRVGHFLHHTISLSSGWLGYSLPFHLLDDSPC